MNTYDELLKRHGYCKGLCGKNSDDENVIVSINDEKATITTCQKNGWLRINVYWKDGTYEELYEH